MVEDEFLFMDVIGTEIEGLVVEAENIGIVEVKAEVTCIVDVEYGGTDNFVIESGRVATLTEVEVIGIFVVDFGGLVVIVEDEFITVYVIEPKDIGGVEFIGSDVVDL